MLENITNVTMTSDDFSVTYRFTVDAPFNGCNGGVQVRFDHVDMGGHWDKPTLEVFAEVGNSGDHKGVDDFSEQIAMLLIVQQWLRENAQQVEQSLRDWEES